MKLKIAYFGTPDFATRLLEKIITDKDLPVEVILVVTQPDKPVGRKQILTPSSVKVLAQKNNIPIYDSNISNLPSTIYSLLSSCDLALLYAYGDFITEDLLTAPKHGFWNIHPSLLPKYRGASPIAYPLILGDTETGVTLMQMDSELDQGPIIAQEKYQILLTNKRSDLETKLTDLGFDIFKKTLPVIASEARQSQTNKIEIASSSVTPRNDNVNGIQQDHSLATYTRRLTKQDGFIPLPILKKALSNEPLDFDELPKIIKDYYNNDIENCLPFRSKAKEGKLKIENSPKIISDYFRGLYPWPGLWTKIIIDGAEKRLKITDLSLVLHTTYSILHIFRVQLEGKQEVSFEIFNKRYQLIS